MKRLMMLILVSMAMLAVTLNVFATEKTSSGFYYPTKTDNFGGYSGWLANQCSPHRDPYMHYIPWDDFYHLGQDIAAPVGSSVYALADGVVEKIQSDEDYPAKPDRWGWGVGNHGLFIRYSLNGGQTFVGLFGHVRTSLKPGDKVVAGQVVANVGPLALTHVHFGVFSIDAVEPQRGFGRLECAPNWNNIQAPNTNGFTDPIAFIQTHTPLNILSHPVGTLVQPVADPDPVEARKVYFLQKVGDTVVKRYVTNADALMAQPPTGNGLKFSEVIPISQEEKACYPKGADITGFEQITQFAGGLHEGQLIYRQNPSPSETFVYIVSGGKLHHLAMTGDELLFAGWKFANVGVDSGPYATDDQHPITLQDLTKCPNQLTVSSPPPGVNLSRTVVPNTDPRYFGLDPLTVFYYDPSDPMRRPTILVGYDGGIRAFRYDASFLWETHDAWDNLELSDVKVDFSPRL